MTTTNLTTPTMGGEVYVGFHRKADGTAYVFADVADSRWQEGFWEGSIRLRAHDARRGTARRRGLRQAQTASGGEIVSTARPIA